jgi:hypothetical protein
MAKILTMAVGLAASNAGEPQGNNCKTTKRQTSKLSDIDPMSAENAI